jgi:hypothetical protein
MDSRFRGNDEIESEEVDSGLTSFAVEERLAGMTSESKNWIPAYVGMTI